MHASDLPSVVTLEKQCQDRPWPAWLFRSTLRSTFSCWVIEAGQNTIGYGIAQYKSRWVHLLNICIAKRFRGMGLGKKITLHLLNEARKHDANLAWLEVRPNNHIAIRLYKSVGFRKARMRRNYYPSRRGRLPAIIMARLL